ncbi:hypothetical protein [Streptomyces scopuliridis]|uniref:hypothetical protein n=1 Tax=Streptomyces scopuliridis TaxID=452529 RepID=UPI00341B9E89
MVHRLDTEVGVQQGSYQLADLVAVVGAVVGAVPERVVSPGQLPDLGIQAGMIVLHHSHVVSAAAGQMGPVTVVDEREKRWQPFDRAPQATGPDVFRGVTQRLLDRTPRPGRGGQALRPVLFVLVRQPPACLIVVDQGAGLALQQRPAPVVGDVKVSP